VADDVGRKREGYDQPPELADRVEHRVPDDLIGNLLAQDVLSLNRK
jgi:hypothetical protein